MGTSGANLNRLATLALLVSVAALACKSPGHAKTTGNLDITVRTLFAGPISSLRVTIQSPTALVSPLEVPVAYKKDQSSVVLNSPPQADDYMVTADALDVSSAIVAHGSAAGISIKEGQTTQVIIYLNQVLIPPPLSNSAPFIDAITISKDAVAPGGQLTLAGFAHDPDSGQTATLAFDWSSSTACGTLSTVSDVPGTDGLHPSESLTNRATPTTTENCEITLTARDVMGLAATVTTIVSAGGGETGAADVTLLVDSGPVISVVTSAPAQLSSLGPTSGVLEVIATDPEGDNLTYAWSTDPQSPCRVDFASPNAAATAFTATPTRADATSCTFIVAVMGGQLPDGGAQKNPSIAGLTLAMTPPVVVEAPPVFGVAYQSYDSAQGGQPVFFGAIAFDPEGGSLGYAWSASPGSTPAATVPTSLGLDPAFTTASTWTVPDGAEALTEPLKVMVTATSSTTGLQSTMTFSLAPAGYL